MKDGFRQSMAWLHTWTGLIVGWVLFFVFMTGTTGYFDDEITRWMQPERPLAIASAPIAPAQGVARAQAFLSRAAPDAERWSIGLPGGRGEVSWTLSWPEVDAGKPRARGEHGEARGKRFAFDPVSAAAAPRPGRGEARDTGGGVGLYRLHYQLHYVSHASAILIVGACTMLMLLAIVSGVITHKKIFKDIFTFRPGKGQRSWLDAHNVISVLALPFFLMITYTGLMFFMYAYMPAAMNLSYGSARQWDNDGYSNPLNPRANAQFEPGAERRGRRPMRSGAGGAPPPAAPAPRGPRAPLTDLSQVVTHAEALWGAGNIESLSIDHPGDAHARVTLHRRSGGLTENSDDEMRFDGVSGAMLDPARPRRHGTWQVQDTMIALHEGLFAGALLRWCYFLAGLLGCAMVGTGLVLWTVKRRRKQIEAGRTDYGFRLVECLNIAAIAGLPLGIAAYFWANRLLPVTMAERAAWEFHSLFLAVGAVLLWASLRRSGKAWVESLRLGAAAYALLPVLNALTTDRHLGVTAPAGDSALAGIDLTMLAIGAVLALAAAKVSASTSTQARSRTARATITAARKAVVAEAKA